MSSIEKAIERLAKAKGEHPAPKTEELSQASKAEAQETAAVQTASTQQKSPPDIRKDVEQSAKKISLDYEALSRICHIVPHSGNKVLEEEYRIIKRPVIRNALGKGAVPIEHGNLVSISSSLPSEGKTFTAFNLALSIATELDSTVLLIDGDVLKYSLSRLLGIENEPGLIDLLSDRECEVSDVIIHTQIPKLKLIGAGTRSEKSTELLASTEMERLLDELALRYNDRIVIFDSPPLLATSEAAVLNHHMGQILVVVEAGQTPVEAIKDSLSRLDQDKAIGLILNKSREGNGTNYYGTYY
ncbi:MAG: XrtA-associated tyrosine autokinase [Candidatus Thiodiazotropha sp.]